MHPLVNVLLEQAGLYTNLNGNYYPVALSAEESVEAYNKLVRSVVLECAKAVNNVPFGYGDYRDQIEGAMRNDCASAVLKIFGIEE